MTAHPAAPLLAVFPPLLAAAAGVAAVALPVAVHLLFRKRFLVVPFAAVRFLHATDKRHRRRVDHLPVLLARVLTLALPLAAMLAVTPWAERLWQAVRPGAPETVTHAPRTHHVLVLDTSLSMTARADDGGSRFDHARRLAELAVHDANPGDGFTVLALGGTPQVVVPGPASDPNKVAAEIRAALPTHAAADPVAGLALVADALARSPKAYPRRQVTVFTDLQRSAWAATLPRPDQPAAEHPWQRVTARADVAVVDVARADLENLAVVDVALADPLPLVDAPAAVTAAVHNFGRSERRLVRVELLLGRPAAVAAPLVPVRQQVIDAVPPGGRAAVTFHLDGPGGFREPGPHVLRVRLLDADDLPADDSRAVVADVRAGLAAVLVNGTPDPEPLRQAAEHLSRALAPPGGRPADTPARPRTVSAAEFADPALGDLSAADCVFLCDVPEPTTLMAARLEAHLKRGGGVVIGLGPNAAAHRDRYNEVLFRGGDGVLPGPLGDVVAAGPDDPGFRLAADDEAFRRPPLAAFRDDNARAGLVTVPFRKYVRLLPPADTRGRRLLAFVPAGTNAAPDGRPSEAPDAAVVEWARHRGRVVVYASTFNRDWTDWPVLPSYLPFAHELLRFAAAAPGRHTARVGDPLDEYYPPAAVGLTARVSGPEGVTAEVPVVAADEAAAARFPDTRLSGLYTFAVGGLPGRVFAVNVPEAAPGGGSESDLRRLEPDDWTSAGPVQVVADPAEIKPASEADGGLVVTQPRPHGPGIARWLVLAALAALALEAVLAWRLGPARIGGAATAARPVVRHPVWRAVGTAAAALPGLVAAGVLLSLLHADRTGQLLGFLPDDVRGAFEAAAGVPAAGPGEGTRWRLEGAAVFSRPVLIGLGLGAAALAVALYRLERRAVGGTRPVVVPALLRAAALLVALFVLLPQLRVAFDREGWPDVAVVLDTSASMDTADALADPAVRAKADELARTLNLPAAHRLQLAQALVARPDAGWLARLFAERQVKVHVYAVAADARPVAAVTTPEELNDARAAVTALRPDGLESRLGDGVQAVLKAFRGGSLAAVVVVTDGVTTAGDALPKAGREAARAGVPLFVVGAGDARDRPDVSLTDLQAEDTVTRGDELVVRARLTTRGADPKALPVTLFEKVGDKLVERARVEARPPGPGVPAAVELRHKPAEVGDKVFVLDVPAQPGETDLTNNRLERAVRVVEARRLRVLLVEGRPRYEFRFVKTLLEREAETGPAGKQVELNTLLLDASPGWAATDRSAEPLRGDFPTREQLFQYDAVILGDVGPRQLPRSSRALQDLADFVRVRGGGLLLAAGEHFNPAAFADTPLADVLPVVPADAGGPKRTEEASPVAEGYRPRLTPTGLAHPLFRFAAADADSAAVWARLQPMLWASGGYKRKLSAEVLAVHPDRPAEGGPPGERHPVVLQQFAGAGRVLFLGFDETWRWRWRADEEQFNRFWTQAVQVLARSRAGRVEVRLDRQTPYRRDERIAVTVRFPDDAPAPPADAPVRVAVTRRPLTNPDGSAGPGGHESSVLQLAKAEGSRATYTGSVTRTPEGDYQFELADREPSAAGVPAGRAEARVLPPRGERDQLDPNRADMVQAAAEGRGKFYSLADADSVVGDLPDAPRVPLNQPRPPVSLWDHPAAFLLLFLLLGGEWLLRKRERLL